MKVNLKSISILGLVAAFFVAAVMCCCFTNTVQAEEPTPSCHQAENETASPQSTEECDCDHSITTIQKATFLNNSLMHVSTFSLDHLFSGYRPISAKVDGYHSPPLVYDISPLYIEYSNLRI